MQKLELTCFLQKFSLKGSLADIAEPVREANRGPCVAEQRICGAEPPFFQHGVVF
jgi:hypothetical protein